VARQVLIVDDEPSVRDFLHKVLMRNGFECRIAEDAGQALAKMNERRADLVLTDVHMPGSDGAWLLGVLKAQWRDVPVIMLTGHEEADVAVECMKSGAADYLLKPVELPKLLAAIGTALESGASAQSVPHGPPS